MVQDSLARGSESFEIGRVISTSIAVFSRNIVAFLALALVIGIPYILVQLFAAGNMDLAAVEQTGQLPDGFWGMVVVGGLIGVLTYVLTQSVIIYGTFQDLRGQRAGFGDSLSRGLAILPRAVIGGLLVSIGIMIGTMLFLVPGIILALMWWVYVPVLVIEGAGIGQAFGRSRELTRGRRWAILGLLVIVFVAQWIIAFVLGLLGTLLGPVGAGIINIAVTLFFAAFSSVVVAVGYYYLRAEKEGIVIDDLARVFD